MVNLCANCSHASVCWVFKKLFVEEKLWSDIVISKCRYFTPVDSNSCLNNSKRRE